MYQPNDHEDRAELILRPIRMIASTDHTMLYLPHIFDALRSSSGRYEGTGMDSDGSHLNSRMVIDGMESGRGIAVSLVATSDDGSIYHEERSLIVAGAAHWLVLMNTFPNIQELPLRSTDAMEGGGIRCTFRRGDVTRKSTMPIELAVELWGDGDVGISYLWGLAGKPWRVQLATRMKRVADMPL